mmetsp:Transcript_104997/g.254885  ORF Transcript_104997/g.254885 Transcript_104997/m.254885 type:complete len:80 (-) Transcript_104997:358-597(-)
MNWNCFWLAARFCARGACRKLERRHISCAKEAKVNLVRHDELAPDGAVLRGPVGTEQLVAATYSREPFILTSRTPTTSW